MTDSSIYDFMQDIAKSLRVLSGRERPEGGKVAQEPIRTFTEPQRGAWRFSEPSDEQLRAYGEELRRLTEPSVTPEGEWQEYVKHARSEDSPLPYVQWLQERQARRLQETGEVSPRLVEKLLNPEGH